MFPAVAPTVLAYDRLREGHRADGKGAAAPATALFVAGYLVVWTTAGLAAYGLFELIRAVDPAFLAWDEAGRYVTGSVIVAAAVYQVTPLKQAGLGRCRRPMMFLAERWRDGRAGALELGIRYGAWCLGCCWALMAALFAVGVMSLGWMALIAAFIAAERLLPWPTAARRAVALSLLALGLGVAFFPADVPGFVEPDGGGHGESMQMMG
jgi:predicted metal-binding membrane protein